MDIEFALVAFLSSRSPVTAIVGTAGVFGDKAKPKVAKYVVVEQAGGEKFYHSQGASNLADADIAVTCKDTTYARAKALYEVLRNELDGFQGTWSGVSIRSAFLSEPNDISVPDALGGSENSDNAVRGLLSVKYVRAVPTLAGM